MFLKKKLSHKHILIAGCGRLGGTLASHLSQEGYEVSVIDKDPNAFHRLHDNYQGFEYQGDAADLQILEDCNIQHSDIVIVCTNDDNVNCMIAQIANIIYHIQEVYIRLNDPDKEEILKGTTIKAIYPALLSIKAFEELSHIQLFKEHV